MIRSLDREVTDEIQRAPSLLLAFKKVLMKTGDLDAFY